MAGAAVVGAAMRMGVIAMTGCFADLGKSSCKQGLNRSVGGACGSCIHLDACLAERVDCAPADAAANEHIDAALRKQSGEGAMASTVAADDFRCDDFSVFDFVDFELLRVAEMLEDFSVGIGGCDFHSALLVCFPVEMGHVERSFRKGAAYVSDSFQPLFPYGYRVYAIARIAILVFLRTFILLRPVLPGHASYEELVIARRHACAKISDSGIIVIVGLHERKTVGDSTKSATAIGLCAVVLWSMMFGFVRLTTQSFGPALGSALIYSCAAVFTYIGYRPTPLRRLPLKYVLFSGGLFVFYETAITLSIGLAASSAQTLELSLVNYLWPTMLVLLSAFDSGSRASLVRALPGAVVATTGVVLAVGGNNNLDWGAVVADVSSNPLPFVLTFAAAAAWAVYSVYSSRFSQGCDATAFFMVGVAAVLWTIFLFEGAPAPAVAPGSQAFFALAGAAGCIASGYACWGHGMLKGDMAKMGIGSYAAPLLSVVASTIILGVSLTPLFWCGTFAVVVGSLINWRMRR